MTITRRFLIGSALIASTLASGQVQAKPPKAAAFDTLITNAQVIDGSGAPAYLGQVGIVGDKIVYVGPVQSKRGRATINADGKVVAPGFINILSWANESLIVDGRGMSDIKQGVTLEVFGEGESMGPLSPIMKLEMANQQSDFKYSIGWTSLGGYLEYMENKGISPNIASFIGAATVREHEIGAANRKATPAELSRMQMLVENAMREGALGVGSSLIYSPGAYADTDELIALNKAASPFGGRYISHMRSEADSIDSSVDELIRIAREANVGAEIYHLKIAGQSNWGRFDAVVEKIAEARKVGLDITANMYTYTAGATGLDASMPTWVQADGLDAWITRLKDPAVRARVLREMGAKGDGWENLYHAAGSPKNLMFIGFKNPKLRPLIGKNLEEVAALRGTTYENTIIDLVIEDGSRVDTVYFLMSEDNVRKAVKLPYISFGSDAEASAPEGVFLAGSTHPRAYGNFARLLGRYVRDEKLISLPEAIRRLTSLPATNLKLRQRGMLKRGYFADIVVFDPKKISDQATFSQPMQYAVGVSHVFVNGAAVLRDGEHTGAKPGRFVRGPGWTGWTNKR